MINPNPFQVQRSDYGGANIANGLMAFRQGLKQKEKEKQEAAALSKYAQSMGYSPDAVKVAQQAAGNDIQATLTLLKMNRDVEDRRGSAILAANNIRSMKDVPEELTQRVAPERIAAWLDANKQNRMAQREQRLSIKSKQTGIMRDEAAAEKDYADAMQTRDEVNNPSPAKDLSVQAQQDAAMQRAIDRAASVIAAGAEVPPDVATAIGEVGMTQAKVRATAITQKAQEQSMKIEEDQADQLANIIEAHQGVVPPQYLDQYSPKVQEMARGIYERRKKDDDFLQQLQGLMATGGSNLFSGNID